MKQVQAFMRVRKSSAAVLLAAAALALVAGCATVNAEDDEGQGRDRPTGGSG